MTGWPSELDDAKYVRLTTFRRNGTPVHTPVWFVRLSDPLGDRLVVWSNADAGKMKRARTTPGVVVARCDRFGKHLEGPEHQGQAVTAEPSRNPELHRMFDRRYGWQKRIMNVGAALQTSVLRRPAKAEAFLLITLG